MFDLNAITFLSPFLEVIRAEETSGPTTSHALTSLNKFIVYDLIGNLLVYGRVSKQSLKVKHTLGEDWTLVWEGGNQQNESDLF